MYADLLDQMIGRLEDGSQGEMAVLIEMLNDPIGDERTKQFLKTFLETISTIRLSVKYLAFDLEATRRENAELRQMLEECDD